MGKVGNFYGFYIQLSFLLREYIDLKLHLSSSSQTTEEFIKSYKNSPILEEWLKEHLFSFLIRADQVKFGSFTPDRKRCDGDLNFNRDFINHLNIEKVPEADNEF